MAISKKCNAGIVLAVILILFVIGGAFVFIYLTYDKEEDAPQYEKIKMYVIAEDGDTRESVDANYYLTYGNDTFLKDGTLTKGSYTEMTVPKNEILHFHCWSDGYYLVKGHKQVTNKEKEINRSVFTCSMAKIGKLDVEGELKDDKIILNITSKEGYYYRMGICFKWTAGILDVNLDDQTIVCENDTWKNYTKYYPENNSYVYLPRGQYKCQDDIENCQIVIGRRCKLSKMEIPVRYKDKVDYCTYTGKTLNPNENIAIELNVATLGT